jgi:hypothetical protein
MSNVHGLNLHYIKDSFNNTGEDYSIYRFTFKSDGTGTYIDGAGNTHTTAWKFTSPDGHNMEFTLTSPNSSTYIWNMVEISEKSFQTITALTIDNNNNILQSTRCVPMKP